MPALSILEFCNRALARIRAGSIQSLTENSPAARECSRFYPEVISEMLEGPHDWSFANRRERLARLATNDREHEWTYAYALPANLASPIRVIPDLGAAGLGLPVPLPGDPYAESWAVQGLYIETPYRIEGSTLYSNIENATLEFTVNDISGLNVSQLVILAVTLELATRLAVPVKGDSEREKTLAQAAEIAWQRAIADDRNRHPEHSGQYVSEAMMARRGYLTEAS